VGAVGQDRVGHTIYTLTCTNMQKISIDILYMYDMYLMRSYVSSGMVRLDCDGAGGCT
jgi:hypothetical protein